MNLRLLKQRITKGNHEQGAAAMEMALLIPIFVLIVLGVLEFGDAWYIHHGLTNASREGARFGIRHPGTFPRNPCPTQAAIANMIKGPNGYLRKFSRFGDCSNVDVDVPAPPCTAGADLTVTVSYPKEWWFLGPLIGLGDVTITATTTMKLE
jgi:hypothetical protein